MLTKQFAFALILLLAIANACALPTARFHSMGISEGIPNNVIRAIAQDDSGFIWFGTDNGLARFDGYQISKFVAKTDSLDNLSNNRIRSLHKDQNGTLWVGTDSGGLNRFNAVTEQFFSFRNDKEDINSLISNRVNTLTSTSVDNLWVGTDKGLDRLNLSTGQFTHYKNHETDANGLPSNQVLSLLQTKTGNLMVGTAAGVVTYDPELNNFKPVKLPPAFNGEVRTMHQSSDGNIWIGTSAGLYQYREESGAAKKHVEIDGSNFFSDKKINAVSSDAEGNIWVGGRQTGLCRISRERPTACYKYDKGTTLSLRDENVMSLFLDHSSSLWIGTYMGGVNRLDLSSLRFGLRDDSAQSAISCLTHSKVNSILVENEVLHWIGTDYGLIRFDQSDGTCMHFDHDPKNSKTLASQEVYSVFRDSRDLLWVATRAGLNRLNESTGHFDRMSGRISAKFTSFLAENKKGQLFVGTEKGVSIYNPTTDHFEIIDAADSRLNTYTWTLQLDKQDRLWVGSAGGLAMLRQGEKSFDFVRNDSEPLVTAVVAAIHLDQKDTIWVGADGIGLIRYDMSGNELTRYNKSDGLPDTTFSFITSDNSGNLWITTPHGGLVRLDPIRRELHVFEEADGVQSNFFMNNAGFRSDSGALFLGGNKGYNSFSPSDIELNKIPPRVVFTRLLLFNQPVISGIDYDGFSLSKPISESHEVEFSHRDYVFAIEFAGLHFADPSRNKYAYKMEGFDPDWVFTDAKNRRATYTNLNSGSYIFRVKSSNKDGIWGDKAQSIRVTILPAPWATWWAYLLYALSTIFTLIAILISRTKALRHRTELLEQTVLERTTALSVEKDKVEQLLSRKNEEFANVSHEFRTPLTLILGPLNQLLKNNKNNTEDNSRLNIIQRNSYRLLRMVDQLLNMETFRIKSISKKVPQSTGQTIRLLTEAFSDLAREKNIEILIIDITEVNFEFTTDALEKIILNLLSNAIKYSKAGDTISVETIRTADNELRIQIIDTGIGIPSDKLNSVFERYHRVLDENSEQVTGAGIGLALVKELVEAHQGKITIESELGEGTKITILLPIIGEVDISQVSTHANDEIIAMELMGLTEQSNIATEPTYLGDGQSTTDKHTVLVIEDNPDMRNYIRSSISDHFNVISANNGEQGLEKAIEEVPDLIISDVMMPKMDGYQTTHALRTNDITNHIPIILLTARGDRESRLKGWHEKADEYLTKPFDIEELKIRLNNLLEIRNILKRRFAETVFLGQEQGHETDKKIDSSIENNNEAELERNNEIHQKFIDKLNNIIESIYSDPETNVAGIAKTIAMSERQFFRKLKSVLDMTPAEYLRRFRLEKSKVLLDQGQSASFAAFEVGFSSQSYYGKCFKAQYGLSPRDYKKTH